MLLWPLDPLLQTVLLCILLPIYFDCFFLLKCYFYFKRALAAEQEYKNMIPRSVGDDRMIRQVEEPESRELNEALLFSDNGKPNMKLLRTHLSKQGILSIGAALKLINEGKALLKSEANLLELEAPLLVFGDMHGQFYDLLNMERALHIGKQQTLFLGDYVDRGDFSTEIVFLLLALKIHFPKNIWMLRGNHESRMMGGYMSFALECDKKYGSEELYVAFSELFDSLPLAALIRGCATGTFFAVHGGISPTLQLATDINKLNRFREPPSDGLMCDLLWSDPMVPPTNPSPSEMARFLSNAFVVNEARETSFMYGPAAVQRFLLQNKLVSIIRAHQVVENGFDEHSLGMRRAVAPVITVFSCPDYCNMYNNQAAVMQIDSEHYSFKQFRSAPHPYYIPEFQDAISFAVPFLMDKIVDVLTNLVIDVKEESAASISSADKVLDKNLAEKMLKLRETMTKREKAEMRTDKIRRQLLDFRNVDMSLFEKVKLVDKRNECAPKPGSTLPHLAKRQLSRSASASVLDVSGESM